MHLIFVLIQVINDVGEKSIEHLQCSINFSSCWISVTNEFEDKVEKWLPNGFFLEFIHSSLDLDQNITKFMNKVFLGNSFHCD